METSRETKLTTLLKYIQDFQGRKISAWNLGLRAKRGLSSSSAYRTKMCVDILSDLPQSEIDRLKKIESISSYIRQFEYFLIDQNKKQALKDIDKSDKFENIIKTLQKEIEPVIVEQQEKIKKYAWSNWERINKEYDQIGDNAFTEKYGRSHYGYSRKSLSEYRRSYPGSLLKMPEKYVERDTKARQDAYKNKEYGKVKHLIGKLAERYSTINNIKLTNTSRSVDGIEFTMKANIGETPIIINTNTIYAGGYNIQRLHLRWLMSVIDKGTGKTMASIRGN